MQSIDNYHKIIKEYNKKKLNTTTFKPHLIRAINKAQNKYNEIEESESYQKLFKIIKTENKFSRDVCFLILDEIFGIVQLSDYIDKLYDRLLKLFAEHYELNKKYKIKIENLSQLKNMSVVWGFTNRDYFDEDFDFLERK